MTARYADFPAAEGQVIKAGHKLYCDTYGHASWTQGGFDTGICPRCGEDSETRIQFILGYRDITNDPYAYADASEVRVWDSESLVIAVAEIDTNTGISLWGYAGSDYGHRLTTEQMSGQYEGWRDAFYAMGVGFDAYA